MDDVPQGAAAASLRSSAADAADAAGVPASERTPDDRGDALPPTPPGGGRLLEWLRRSGRGASALAAAWALWLLAATQISQARGPDPVSDGLARGDWITIEALGLDSLGDGLPLWLLLALSVAFAVGMLGVQRGSARGDRGSATRSAIWLAGAALALWIASTVAAAAAPPPRWLDLPVVAADARPVQPAQALSFEQGRWQRAALAAGSCSLVDGALRCTLPEGGDALVFGADVFGADGVDGHAIVRDDLIWVRRGVQSDAEAAAGRLELDAAISGQGRVGFDVGPERATIVPALRARVALVGTRRTGPIVIGRIGDGPTQLLASPGLATGPAAARLRAMHRVRLLGAAPWPGRLGTLAALLALVAAALAAFGASRQGATLSPPLSPPPPPSPPPSPSPGAPMSAPIETSESADPEVPA